MKNLIFGIISLLFLASCHKSLEERAAEEARNYTKRCCPTPVINCSRTDSVTFDIENREYTYYCSFIDQLDDELYIREKRQEISQGLYESLAGNAGMKTYVDAGYSFTYVVRSGKNPEKVLYKETFHVAKRDLKKD